jgi:signal transduction histidine kinase
MSMLLKNRPFNMSVMVHAAVNLCAAAVRAATRFTGASEARHKGGFRKRQVPRGTMSSSPTTEQEVQLDRKVWANTFRARSDKVIALGRVMLAAGCVGIAGLDSAHVPLPPGPIYLLLAVYFFYAVVVAIFTWRTEIAMVRGTLVRHVIDVVAFAAFMWMTDGTSSPYFVLMPFALLSATLHWRWRGAFWSGLTCLLILVCLGYFDTGDLFDPDAETTTIVSRLLFIFVAAILLIWLGAHHEAVRAELVRLVQRAPALPQGREWPAAAALKYAANVMLVRRALLIWSDNEEPWTYVALWEDNVCEVTQMPPDAFGSWTDKMLRRQSLLILDARRNRLLVHKGDGCFDPWIDERPPLSPTLIEAFTLTSAISVHFEVGDLQARLFLLEPPALTLDDVAIAEIIADRIKALFEQAMLVRRLSDEAAVEARIRIGRDLHDGVLQTLAGTALQLQSLRPIGHQLPEGLEQRLMAIQSMLLEEQRELRTFIRALEPALDDRASEEAQLEHQFAALVDRLMLQWRIDVRLALAPAKVGLPMALIYDLARMTSEATANAVRHGGAQKVRIKLRTDRKAVVLTVADNGVGFGFGGRVEHAELERKKMGPRSLCDRTTARGGKLAIERVAKWTRVVIILPIPH